MNVDDRMTELSNKVREASNARDAARYRFIRSEFAKEFIPSTKIDFDEFIDEEMANQNRR